MILKNSKQLAELVSPFPIGPNKILLLSKIHVYDLIIYYVQVSDLVWEYWTISTISFSH